MHAAGPYVLRCASTASWGRLTRPVRTARVGSSIASSPARSPAWDASTDVTTASRSSSWPVVKESRDTQISPKIQSSWPIRSRNRLAQRPAMNRCVRWPPSPHDLLSSLYSCTDMDKHLAAILGYNFQMDHIHNLPSSEEISFKLTELLLPSFANSKGTLVPLQSSLQYTHSLISIQNMLESQREISLSPQKNEGSGFSKNGSLKTSSVNTAESSAKHTPRASFRERVVTSRKTTNKQSIQRRLSFHLLEFQQEQNGKGPQIHAKDRQRSLSEKRPKTRSSLKGENLSSVNYSDVRQTRQKTKLAIEETDVLFSLKKSMHIKQIKLRADQQREKNYMKRILQNRLISIHLQDLSSSTPVSSLRNTRRI